MINTLKDNIKKEIKEVEITDELIEDVLKDYEKEIEEDNEPYCRFDSFDLEKVKTVALELGFRKNTQKLADSLNVVAWIERKLQKLGKMQSREVEYSLEYLGIDGKGKMIVFDQCVTLYTSAIAEDLGIPFSRAQKAKETLSKIGLISFLKTIKTSDDRFLKLWIVNLEYFCKMIFPHGVDIDKIDDISAEEAERNVELGSIMDDFMEGIIDAEEYSYRTSALLYQNTDENDDITDGFMKDFDSLADIISNDSFADIDISSNIQNGEVKMKKENKDFKVSIDSDEDLKAIDDFYDAYLIEKLFSDYAGKSGLS